MPIVPNDPFAVQRTDTVRVECPVCGESFLLFPSQQSRYCCSWKCRRIYAQSPERQQARFLSHVDVADEACWLWMAYCDDDGYGVTSDTSGEGKGRTIQAHRRAYELFVGEIPSGMCVCHRCDTPACVNPDHLFLGTQQDNQKDKTAKGRQAKGGNVGVRLHPESYSLLGEDNNAAKLTDAQVREIRARHQAGEAGYKRLADEYGVSKSVIRDVIKRITWSHID